MREPNLHNKTVGNEGEEKAAKFLAENGYTIITRNWRHKTGEIDIIAEKNETLIFAEVKTLPNGSAELLALELNKIKQQKIIKTAKCFLQIYRKYNSDIIRFDVLVVDMPGLPPVHHIENAFSEQI